MKTVDPKSIQAKSATLLACLINAGLMFLAIESGQNNDRNSAERNLSDKERAVTLACQYAAVYPNVYEPYFISIR